MGRRILRCRTWPLGVSPLSGLQKAHPYSLPGKPLQTLEQIIIRQPSREQRKRTCGQVSKRNLLHSDTVGRKLCRLRRNDDYHCNGAGIDSLKARLKETWMAGDYDRFSRYMEQGARIFY